MKRRWLLTGIGVFIGSLYSRVWGQTRIKGDQIELIIQAGLNQKDLAANNDGVYTRRLGSILFRNGVLMRPDDMESVSPTQFKVNVTDVGVITEVWYGGAN